MSLDITNDAEGSHLTSCDEPASERNLSLSL
jgi:hypothetical protein